MVWINLFIVPYDTPQMWITDFLIHMEKFVRVEKSQILENLAQAHQVV